MATKSVECQLSFFEHLLFSNIFWGELLLKGNFFCKWSHLIKYFFEKSHVTHNLIPQLTFAPMFVKSLNCGPQLTFTFLIHLLSICVTIQMIAKAL